MFSVTIWLLICPVNCLHTTNVTEYCKTLLQEVFHTKKLHFEWSKSQTLLSITLILTFIIVNFIVALHLQANTAVKTSPAVWTHAMIFTILKCAGTMPITCTLTPSYQHNRVTWVYACVKGTQKLTTHRSRLFYQ